MPILCILLVESKQRMLKTPLPLCLANFMALPYFVAVNVADFITFKLFLI